MQKKDGSSVKPKISVLEKAIRELQKIVLECTFYICTEVHISIGGIVGSSLQMLTIFLLIFWWC